MGLLEASVSMTGLLSRFLRLRNDAQLVGGGILETQSCHLHIVSKSVGRALPLESKRN